MMATIRILKAIFLLEMLPQDTRQTLRMGRRSRTWRPLIVRATRTRRVRQGRLTTLAAARRACPGSRDKGQVQGQGQVQTGCSILK